MEKDQQQRDRLEEEQAAVLPGREAMSIITATDPQESPSGEEGVTSETPGEHIKNEGSLT